MSNHITGSTSLVTETYVIMQARAVPSCMQQACGPCRHRIFHMDSRKHQTSRDQTDSHAMVRLIPMHRFVRWLRVTAPNGTKRKRLHIAINTGNWRPAAGTMPRRCWDKLEAKPHPWFNQHGHGSLRMQARAVPSCMQQACGPFRHRTLHMDSRNHQDPQIRDATQFHAMVRTAPHGNKRKRSHLTITRCNWRHAAGTTPSMCWDKLEVHSPSMVQPAWSRKPAYASKIRARLHAARMRAVSSPHVSHGHSDTPGPHICS